MEKYAAVPKDLTYSEKSRGIVRATGANPDKRFSIPSASYSLQSFGGASLGGLISGVVGGTLFKKRIARRNKRISTETYREGKRVTRKMIEEHLGKKVKKAKPFEVAKVIRSGSFKSAQKRLNKILNMKMSARMRIVPTLIAAAGAIPGGFLARKLYFKEKGIDINNPALPLGSKFSSSAQKRYIERYR